MTNQFQKRAIAFNRVATALGKDKATNHLLNLLAEAASNGASEIETHPAFADNRGAFASELLEHNDLLAATPKDAHAMRCIRSGRVVGWIAASGLSTHVKASIAPAFIRLDREAFSNAIAAMPAASAVALMLVNLGGDRLEARIAESLAEGTSQIDIVQQRAGLVAHMHDGLLASASHNTISLLHSLITFLQDNPNEMDVKDCLAHLFMVASAHSAIQPLSARKELALALQHELNVFQANAIRAALSGIVGADVILGSADIDALAIRAYRARYKANEWEYVAVTPTAKATKEAMPSAKTMRHAKLAAEFGQTLSGIFDISDDDLAREIEASKFAAETVRKQAAAPISGNPLAGLFGSAKPSDTQH